jgi:hypothetical protein
LVSGHSDGRSGDGGRGDGIDVALIWSHYDRERMSAGKSLRA